MDEFRKGLSRFMGDDDEVELPVIVPTEAEPGVDLQVDVDSFRRSLINQARADTLRQRQEFTGYDFFDLIVDKWGVPYDIQINKTVFAGKPVLCFNVMWKHLGQQSFHLTEQEYLEHLEALAQLLKEWDRVDHFKKVLREAKKQPNAYFGYAVALPLDLPPDTLAGYFNDSYF
ncbi:unnamed protein product [Discosporangium mesarthrocarpum]